MPEQKDKVMVNGADAGHDKIDDRLSTRCRLQTTTTTTTNRAQQHIPHHGKFLRYCAEDS